MKKIALTLLTLSIVLLSSCGSTPADTTAVTEKPSDTSSDSVVDNEEAVISDDFDDMDIIDMEEIDFPESDEIVFDNLTGKTLGELEDEYDITFDYIGQFSVSHCYADSDCFLGYAPLVSYKLDDYRVSTVTGAILEGGSFRGIRSGMSYNEIAGILDSAEVAKPVPSEMDDVYRTIFEVDGYRVIIEWYDEYNDDLASELIIVCRPDYVPTDAESKALEAQEGLLYTDADIHPTFDNIIGRRLNYVGEHFFVEFGYLGQLSFIYDYNDFSEDFPYLPITAFDFFMEENPKIIGAALGKGGNFRGITAGMTYEEMTEHISADILGRPSFDEEGSFSLKAEIDDYILSIDWGESYFGDDQPCIFVAAYDKNYPMAEQDGAIYEATSTAVG